MNTQEILIPFDRDIVLKLIDKRIKKIVDTYTGHIEWHASYTSFYHYANPDRSFLDIILRRNKTKRTELTTTDIAELRHAFATGNSDPFHNKYYSTEGLKLYSSKNGHELSKEGAHLRKMSERLRKLHEVRQAQQFAIAELEKVKTSLECPSGSENAIMLDFNYVAKLIQED